MLMVTDLNEKLGTAIDRTMQYYALFRYPLLPAEVRHGCQAVCSEEEVYKYLREQQTAGNLYCLEGFFSTDQDIEALVRRRKKGNDKAAHDLVRARRAGRLIYRFPFVQFVGISGSLSKGYSDPQTDFDFFIVTAPDRLWITRTLLHLFKKLTFAVGLQHRFCMNYFIDETVLELEERNIYTATELSTMLPVCGSKAYRQLMQANSWVRQVLPNMPPADERSVCDRSGMLKRLSAHLINCFAAGRLNRLLMLLTDRKWRKKWAMKGFPAEDYDLAFKTTLHISKNHPANYQKRILAELSLKDK